MRRLVVAGVVLGTLALAPVASAIRQPCSPPTASIAYHSPPNSTYVDVLFTVCADNQAYNVYGKVVPEIGHVDWFMRASGIILPESTQFEQFQYLTRFAPGNWYVQLFVFQGTQEVAFAEYEFTK